MPKDCDGALAQDVTRRLQSSWGHPLQGHGVFHGTNRGDFHSLVVVCGRVGSHPEMLCHCASSRNLSGRSLLSQARAWCKAVIEATADHVCAYEPSLGFYQAMGSA